PPPRVCEAHGSRAVAKHAPGTLSPERVRLFGQVRHEEIEQAVAVYIAQGNSHVPLDVPQAVVSQAALHGFFGKSAIALVDPEMIGLGVVGDENVRPAVAV